MSPFSHFLLTLRSRHNVKQAELAKRLGYAKSYISALESGQKGPPSPVFLECIAQFFELDEQGKAEMHAAVEASNRSLTIPHSASPEMFCLLQALREAWPALNPSQIRIMTEVIGMTDSCRRASPFLSGGRAVNQKQEAKM